MSDSGVAYLDSSAIVKLVVEEPESTALRDRLTAHGRFVSCALARVEVLRAVHPHGPRAVRRARRVVGSLELLVLDDALLDAAAALPGALRSLDAIHVAAALQLEGELAELLTYDRRMAGAATAHGLAVAAPR